MCNIPNVVLILKFISFWRIHFSLGLWFCSWQANHGLCILAFFLFHQSFWLEHRLFEAVLDSRYVRLYFPPGGGHCVVIILDFIVKPSVLETGLVFSRAGGS